MKMYLIECRNTTPPLANMITPAPTQRFFAQGKQGRDSELVAISNNCNIDKDSVHVFELKKGKGKKVKYPPPFKLRTVR
jgi:hypothetical protein